LSSYSPEVELSQGSLSYVFEGTFKNSSLVVKTAKPEQNLQTEISTLQILSKHDLLTPKLVISGPTYIGLTPLAIPLLDWLLNKNLRRDHLLTTRGLTAVLSTLEYVHTKLQLVHCDISLSNLLLCQDGSVILNGWGSCRGTGERMTSFTKIFVGTSVLRGDWTADCRNDLESWLFSLFVLVFPLTHESLRDLTTEEDILRWRETRVRRAGWGSLLACASLLQPEYANPGDLANQYPIMM